MGKASNAIATAVVHPLTTLGIIECCNSFKQARQNSQMKMVIAVKSVLNGNGWTNEEIYWFLCMTVTVYVCIVCVCVCGWVEKFLSG